MYILKCADGSYYTGSTIDLERRLWQHQNGEGANFTKKRLPVKLVYAEPFDRVEDAFRREKQIQGWSRRKKKALIEGNYDKLIEFSRNYTQYGDPASASSTSGGTDEPLPELVEGSILAHDPASTDSASIDPASIDPASASSASGGTDEPLPELVEGSGGLAAQLAEESRLNTLIQENLAKVVVDG